MTDPNVIEAVRKMAHALLQLTSEDTLAQVLANQALALIAAEKPAAPATPTPVAIGDADVIRYDPRGNATDTKGRILDTWGEDQWSGLVDDNVVGVQVRADKDDAARVFRAMRDAGLAAAHGDVPAPAAPATPALPWVVRRRSDGMVLAQCALVSDATTVQHAYNDGYAEVVEVAAPAPAIVPVKFDADGGVLGAGWSAFHAPELKHVSVVIELRPGEDAGDLTARIVAAAGRGP